MALPDLGEAAVPEFIWTRQSSDKSLESLVQTVLYCIWSSAHSPSVVIQCDATTLQCNTTKSTTIQHNPFTSSSFNISLNSPHHQFCQNQSAWTSSERTNQDCQHNTVSIFHINPQWQPLGVKKKKKYIYTYTNLENIYTLSSDCSASSLAHHTHSHFLPVLATSL